jgi:hypothetical protein
MPINRLLKDKRTPEEIELLNQAFNHAPNLLGVVDRNDALCDLVARKVIEVGTTGISEASLTPQRIAPLRWSVPPALARKRRRRLLLTRSLVQMPRCTP